MLIQTNGVSLKLDIAFHEQVSAPDMCIEGMLVCSYVRVISWPHHSEAEQKKRIKKT